MHTFSPETPPQRVHAPLRRPVSATEFCGTVKYRI